MKRIAVVGGTGQLGSAIAGRLAKAGYPVVIGSRTEESASRVAASLGSDVAGAQNLAAVGDADIVLLTVPFSAQESTLREIAPLLGGKILVDTTVPLVPPRVMRVQLPAAGSAALQAAALVDETVKLVSAFHNVAAHKLATDADIDCDVLVFGDDPAARGEVIALAEAMRLRALHAGSLANSVAAEALTSVLIFLNKHHALDGAGIRISGGH